MILLAGLSGCGPAELQPPKFPPAKVSADAPPQAQPQAQPQERQAQHSSAVATFGAPSPQPFACRAEGFAAAAQANAISLNSLPFDIYGRPEVGWEVYAPVVAREAGADCPPNSEGFAEQLSKWAPGRARDGRVTEALLKAVVAAAQRRRPPHSRVPKGVCPDAPPPEALSTARREESYGGKTIELRTGALAAYHAMTAAARDEVDEVRRDPRFLTIFSGYRSPDADAARCLKDMNCDGVVRSVCSPHRTGLAMDIYVGQTPDFGPDSSADPNRLAQSRTATYAWLVRNAGRFGFIGYPFEPWHWEWTGEAP